MKLIGGLALTFFSQTLIACPYCAGFDQSGKDQNTTLILGVFILAIYIPYFIIYRLIKKFHKNDQPTKSTHT